MVTEFKRGMDQKENARIIQLNEKKKEREKQIMACVRYSFQNVQKGGSRDKIRERERKTVAPFVLECVTGCTE